MSSRHRLGALLLTAAACGSPPAEPPEPTSTAVQPVWTNGDFEADPIGTTPPTGWTISSNRNIGLLDLRPLPQTLLSLNLALGGTSMTYVVGGAAESQTDPDIGAAGTLRYPKYGSRAVRVNYANANANGNNYNSNTFIQQMTVGAGDVDPTDNKVHVRFAVAPVLQNPAHEYNHQPYYFVRLHNITKDITVYSDFNASGQPGVPWKNFTDASGQAAQYTDWQLVDIAPGAHQVAIGDQVELRVIASGCSQGGHWGRVYVDGVGAGVPGLYTWGAGPQQANAGSSITYTLRYRNGGTTTTTGAVLDFVTPPNTTYQSVAGATCTAPPAGATGTVSCSLGTLAPGATGALSVTVGIPAATPAGTVITNGNYSILASGVSPLIGPKVQTTVTSGVSYADVSITKTDGVAARGWGQATTYTLVASNAGPLATTATVTDAMPARLTGVTWTCTAAGGATCTASGSGSIGDAISLPAGGSATYTVQATVVAGSGTGQVVNTASIAVTGDRTDPDTANNIAVDANGLGTLRTLTVTRTLNASAGAITSVPAAINCGSTCSAEFIEGSQVVLTATPAAGATFAGWGGACAGSGSTCTVTVGAAQSVTAAFVGAPAAVAATGGADQSAAVSTAFAQPLAVTVTDSLGYPVPGVTVQLATPTSGASAALSSATAVTNGSGVAAVTATANETAGSYGVTAAVAGVAAPATFALRNIGAPASITVASGSGQSATVGTAYAAELVARVRDAANQPVPGAAVTFARPTSGASITGATSAVTDASGLARIAATATTTAGAFTVTATVPGLAAQAVFSLANTAGAAATLAIISGNQQTATVAAAFAQPLVVAVSDMYGNPVAGHVVALVAPSSGATAVLQSTALLTGPNGRASTTATAGTVAGSYAITASAAGTGGASFTLTQTAGAPAAIAAVSGGGQSASVGQAFAAPLVARVRDAYGNPVAGVGVSATAPATGASALLAPAGAETNAAGLVSIGATANTRAGAYAVAMAAAGIAAPATFALENRAGAPATVAIGGGDDQQQRVTLAFPAPLEVIVRDVHGNAVPGAQIAFAGPAAGAGAQLSAATVTTNASGRATVTATANTVAGAYQVTARAGALEAPFALRNLPGPAAALAITGGSGQSAVVDTALAAPLAVVLRDAYGNAVPGAQVAFSAPLSGPTAALAATSVTTDAAGAASVTATAGRIAGAYTVTASASGVPSVQLAITNLPGAPATIELLPQSSPQLATVGEAFAQPIAIRVADRFGNAAPGATVLLAAPATGATAALSAAQLTTDASGNAAVTATAGTVAGAYTVTVTLAGTEASVAVSLTNLAGAPATVSVSDGDAQSAVVDTAFARPLAVRVTDALGNPVPGAAVAFAAPVGGATAVIAASPVATGADGTAAVAVRAGTVTGAYQVTAIVAGATAPAAFALSNTPGAPAMLVAAPAATPQSARVGTAFAQPFAARVTDAFGNPVPGVAVAYAAPATGATAALSAPTAVTDADGWCRVDAMAGSVTGAYVVTASVPGATAAFELSNLAGGPASLALVGGGAQEAVVDTAFAAPVVVEVRDGFGNAVPGAAVTFAAPVTGPSAALQSPAAVTGADGRAATALVAGRVAGAYQLLATVADGAAPLAVPLANLPDVPAAITAVESGRAQSAQVGTAFALPLAVLVTDRFGNPVPGAAIAFAGPLAGAGASLSAPLAETDLAGRAEVLAVAGPIAGGYVVTAAVIGVATGARFTLTNTPAAPSRLLVDSGAGQRTLATAAFPQPVVVRILDGLGNPVPGAAVIIDAPATGPSVALAAPAPLADAEGRVSLALVARGIPGPLALMARAEGAVGAAEVALAIDAIPTSITAAAAPLSVDEPMAVHVVVRGELGIPAGRVEIVDETGAVLAAGELDARGEADVALPAMRMGAHAFTARYAAQGSYGASRSATLTLEVTEDAGLLSGGACAAGGGGGAGGLVVLLALALAVRGRRGARSAVPARALPLIALLVGAAALLAPSPASAQEAGARAIERLHAAAADSEWFAADSVSFAGDSVVTVSALTGYAHRPLVAYAAGGDERGVVVRHAVVTQFGGSVVLQDRLRLAATVPMAWFQDGARVSYNGMMMARPTFAFGDVSLAADARVLGAAGGRLRLAAGVRVTLPAGSRTNYMSDGVVGIEPRVAAAGSAGRLEYAATASAFLRERTELAGLRFGHELRFAAAVGVRLAGGALLVGPELIGAAPLASGTSTGTPMEASLGAHLRVRRDLQLGLGAGLGIHNAVGAADERVVLSVGWLP